MLYLWVGRHPVVPLVLMCRVWRWRDVEVDQLVRLPICQYTPDILLECCNPYHWARGANPGIVFCIQYSYSVSIYIYLLVCLSVSNKRQNCWTDRTKIVVRNVYHGWSWKILLGKNVALKYFLKMHEFEQKICDNLWFFQIWKMVTWKA